jgi:hypothetical protein
MVAEQRVTITLLPSLTNVNARIADIYGRILRLHTEYPMRSGMLMKATCNGDVILGEVSAVEPDGFILVSIRHRLAEADLREMRRNWTTPAGLW